MFEFFDVIINFLTSIVDYIGKFIELIIYLFTFVFQGITYAYRIVLYLPPWLLPFIYASIAISIIYLLLNR